MTQFIPIKWLRFEEALKYKIEKGEPLISLDEARRVARDECDVDSDQQFYTLLYFLHDQRILIHFDKAPKMKNTVILDPQWLIDLFRKVITVKAYDPSADEEQCKGLWRKLETEGILDEKLLQILWGPCLTTLLLSWRSLSCCAICLPFTTEATVSCAIHADVPST